MAISIVKATSIDLLTTSADNFTAGVEITDIAGKVNPALSSGNFHDVVEMGIELSLTNIDTGATGVIQVFGEMEYGDGNGSDVGRILLAPPVTYTGTTATTINVPLDPTVIGPAPNMHLWIADSGGAIQCDLAVVAAVKAVVSS